MLNQIASLLDQVAPMLNQVKPLLHRLRQCLRTIQNQITYIIGEGILTGEFKASVNADLFSIKMFNLLEGTILACRVMKNRSQMKIVTGLLKEEIASFKK